MLQWCVEVCCSMLRQHMCRLSRKGDNPPSHASFCSSLERRECGCMGGWVHRFNVAGVGRRAGVRERGRKRQRKSSEQRDGILSLYLSLSLSLSFHPSGSERKSERATGEESAKERKCGYTFSLYLSPSLLLSLALSPPLRIRHVTF